MRITADTNLLVRIIVRDDHGQAEKALHLLSDAEVVFIPPTCLCELVWVLGSTYQLTRDELASSVRAVIDRENVSIDVPTTAAGLRVLEAGGDFADGAIAAAGAAMGSEIFVSFDRKAIARIAKMGIAARHVDMPA